MTAKKPAGTEAFDKHYGIGYKVGHDGFSPYSRVNKLRKVFLERKFNIDIQRARLITQTYREKPELSAKLKTAYSLKNILEHVEIDLYEDELLAGELAAPAKAAPIYPEFSAEWIIDELKNHPFDQRAHDKFYITEEDKEELLELLEFWRGKTIADAVEANLTEDQKKGSEMGKKVYMTNLYHFGGVGHFVMDYEKLLKVGYQGLIAEAEASFAALDPADGEYAEKRIL